jgi:ABC-type uncharacterized transport system substrate-binding protein
LAFLKQIAPDLRRIAVVHVPEIVPNVAFLHVVEAAAPSLGVSVTAAEVRNAADIERVLSALGREGGGLIVTPSALTATRRDLIIALAARLRLPAIYSFGFYAESGGLMSYGINQLEHGHPGRDHPGMVGDVISETVGDVISETVGGIISEWVGGIIRSGPVHSSSSFIVVSIGPEAMVIMRARDRLRALKA